MKTPQRHRRHRQPRADGGFVLLEAIVSIALITILMTALTALFVSTMKVTNHQRMDQGAVRVITDVLDQARSSAVDRNVIPPSVDLSKLPTTVDGSGGGTTYRISYFSSWCSIGPIGGGCDAVGNDFVRITATACWGNPSGTCGQSSPQSYTSSVLISARKDPIFTGG